MQSICTETVGNKPVSPLRLTRFGEADVNLNAVVLVGTIILLNRSRISTRGGVPVEIATPESEYTYGFKVVLTGTEVTFTYKSSQDAEFDRKLFIDLVNGVSDTHPPVPKE